MRNPDVVAKPPAATLVPWNGDRAGVQSYSRTSHLTGEGGRSNDVSTVRRYASNMGASRLDQDCEATVISVSPGAVLP